MLSRLTITQKALALIAIPLLCQVAYAAVLIRGQARRSGVEDWAVHTKNVISQAEAFYRVLLEVDSEVDAFAVIGEERTGFSFERTLARLPVESQALAKLVADNPAQVARVRTIESKTNAFVGEMRSLHDLAQTRNAAAVADRVRSMSLRDPIADIRRDLDTFIGNEEALDRDRLQALAKVQVLMFRVITFGMAGIILVGILCSWFFGREIVGRLRVLNDNVRRFSAGQPMLARLGGTDEVAVLDDSFRRMAEGLGVAAAKEKEFQENLERRAGELTVINRELIQKSEENEMFVYSVSHDLRSPLVNLQGFSKELSISMREMRDLFQAGEVPSGMRAQGEDILDHGMAEPVTFIQTAVTRLSAIIDALLRLSRAGRVEYQKREVETDAIVHRVIDASRSTMTEKKAQVSVAGELPKVVGDPTAIEQIFGNLVSNALNYLDKKRPGIIEIGSHPCEHDPALVTCYVKDNGLGIPEAYLGKIFGIFQRVHGNIAVGEGIGLALVRRMAERHGGRIWVESREGAGSTFFVALPLFEPAPVVPLVEETPELAAADAS